MVKSIIALHGNHIYKPLEGYFTLLNCLSFLISNREDSFYVKRDTEAKILLRKLRLTIRT